MIVLDFQLGRFDVVVEWYGDWRPLKVTPNGPGDVTVDLPFFRIHGVNLRRWNAAHNNTVSQ